MQRVRVIGTGARVGIAAALFAGAALSRPISQGKTREDDISLYLSHRGDASPLMKDRSELRRWRRPTRARGFIV